MPRLKDLSGKASSGPNRRAYMQAYAKGVNRGNSKTRGPSLDTPAAPKLDFGALTQGSPGVGSSRNYSKGVSPGGQSPTKSSLDAASFSMLPRHVDLIEATGSAPGAGLMVKMKGF